MSDDVVDTEQVPGIDDPDADGEYDVYFTGKQERDQHEEDMQKRIRDRGRMVFMLCLVLAGSVYSNAYQLTLPKNVPYIHNVDSHGQVVTRILLRPEEIPPGDPYRQAFIRNYIEDWVTNARIRSRDASLTVKGINSALRMSAGPAAVKLSTVIAKEEVGARIKKESVVVRMPKSPVLLVGDSWQAEWEEEVTGASNVETRRETWTGTFQLASQPNWITEKNPYGYHIVDWDWAPVNR